MNYTESAVMEIMNYFERTNTTERQLAFDSGVVQPDQLKKFMMGLRSMRVGAIDGIFKHIGVNQSMSDRIREDLKDWMRWNSSDVNELVTKCDGLQMNQLQNFIKAETGITLRTADAMYRIMFKK